MNSTQLIENFAENGTLNDQGASYYTAQLDMVNSSSISKIEKLQKEKAVLNHLLKRFEGNMDKFSDFIHGGIYTGTTGRKNIANYNKLVKDRHLLIGYINKIEKQITTPSPLLRLQNWFYIGKKR